MLSGGGKGGCAVGVQILVLIIGLLFIVKFVIVASVMMWRGLVSDIIGSAGVNIPMLAGEGVSQRE